MSIFSGLLGILVLGFWILGKQDSEKPKLSGLPEPKTKQKIVDSDTVVIFSTKQIQPIDINLADTATWATLPYIGQKISQRIVKERYRRGGFRSIAEVRTVWGMDTIFTKIETYLRFDPANLPTIQPKDLNTATTKELLAIGLSEKQITRLLSYRENIHGFKKWETIEKMKSLRPDDIEALKRHFRIERLESNRQKRPPVNINTADSITLEKLPLIGIKLASRIVKYRERLGFYYDKKQLLEVWGLKPETYQVIDSLITVGTDFSTFPHLKINQATVEQLAKHPYLNFSIARRIVDYKKQHGNFRSISDLQKLYGVEPDVWKKLEPYLDFSD
ncbi:MAG: helix-hairpin-helix domain-containing protein [Bacteroidia bacterium]|nr:helix-hairpin-helix domain-containing protein [Bacteroidia bacterium]